MNDEKTIQLDRMRFTKNTMSSNLALLAILFDVLFFISIYESDKASASMNPTRVPGTTRSLWVPRSSTT